MHPRLRSINHVEWYGSHFHRWNDWRSWHWRYQEKSRRKRTDIILFWRQARRLQANEGIPWTLGPTISNFLVSDGPSLSIVGWEGLQSNVLHFCLAAESDYTKYPRCRTHHYAITEQHNWISIEFWWHMYSKSTPRAKIDHLCCLRSSCKTSLHCDISQVNWQLDIRSSSYTFTRFQGEMWYCTTWKNKTATWQSTAAQWWWKKE